MEKEKRKQKNLNFVSCLTLFSLGTERYSGGGWIRGYILEAEYSDASRVQYPVNGQDSKTAGPQDMACRIYIIAGSEWL